MKRLIALTLAAAALAGAGCNQPDEWAEDPDTASAAGVPPDATRAEARRRAEHFWRSRGELTACADNAGVRFHSPGETVYMTPTGYPTQAYTVEPKHAGMATGCLTPGFEADPVPRIILNERKRWSNVRRLCVAYAHEIGHLLGAPHLSDYDTWHGKHWAIMHPNGPPVWNEWGPCQA